MLNTIKEKKHTSVDIHSNLEVNKLINTSLNNKELLIRSKDRVKNLAEVYTAKREVQAMLNLIPSDIWNKIDSTFLEPACGDGNFVEAIILKKLEAIKQPKQIRKNQNIIEYNILTALSSVYGVDICSENIQRCKERIINCIKSFYSNNYNTLNSTFQFENILNEIVNSNYIEGDTLNEADKILIVQWERPIQFYFKKNIYKLGDLSKDNCKPIKQEKMIAYTGK